MYTYVKMIKACGNLNGVCCEKEKKSLFGPATESP